MRRSSYAGTPSPAKEYHKGMRKKTKKSNRNNLSSSPKSLEKKSHNQKQNEVLDYSQNQSTLPNFISDPEILSQYFLLFLAQKKLVSITKRKYLVRFFREWQHHFTSSVLKNLSNSAIRQNKSLNPESKKLLHSQGTQITAPNFSLNNEIDNRKLNLNSPPKAESPPKHLRPFENSSFSPKSPSLIATLSPKEEEPSENISDLSTFSIDDVLNFSENQKFRHGSIVSQKKNNEISSLLNTSQNFIPSDEFDQIDKSQTANTNYHLFAETLPDDLFSSDSYSNLPKQQTQTEISINQDQVKSPIRLNEELLIKAALEDEFVHDKKSSPSSKKKKKRRKIIIVKEYSDSGEDSNEVYEYYSRSPNVSKGNNNSNGQIKYTFSDESFSDEKQTNLSSTIEMSKLELNSKPQRFIKSSQTDNFDLPLLEEKDNISDELTNSDENEDTDVVRDNDDEVGKKGIYRIIGHDSSDEIDYLIRDTDDNQTDQNKQSSDYVDYSQDAF